MLLLNWNKRQKKIFGERFFFFYYYYFLFFFSFLFSLIGLKGRREKEKYIDFLVSLLSLFAISLSLPPGGIKNGNR